MLSSTPPFFIIGVHRSGTTLLRFMLCSHSRIYIPPESDFIPLFFRKAPHEPLNDERISDILKIIFTRYRFVGEWQDPVPEVSDLLALMSDRTPTAFLNSLYTLYVHQMGKVRWGDKTPIYASYVDLLHTIFPSAKFIHILRDPYDACLSLLEKYQKEEYHIDIYYAARNWARRINQITSSHQHLSHDLYHELHYEDLVMKPERNLREICDFLGETYEPVMLEQHLLAQTKITPDSHFFANVRNPINSASIGRGIKVLSIPDQRLIQQVAGPTMIQNGYSLMALGKMDAKEKIRMALLRGKYEFLQMGRRTTTKLNLMPPI